MDTEYSHTPEGSAVIELELKDLYERYAGELVRYAGSLSRNGDASRDAVQEAFLRFFMERRFGRRIESPRAWLYAVVRNYLVQQMPSAAEQAQSAEVDIEKIADRSAGPDTLLQRSQMISLVATMLTARENECLNLRLEGLGYAAIATVLGVHLGTVSTLLARVRTKVRRAAWCNGGGSAEILMRGAACL